MTKKNRPTVTVPELDHDAMMSSRYGHAVGPRGRTERRIVAALIAHMHRHGWRVSSTWDGEERTAVPSTLSLAESTKAAMEKIFNLDEVSLRFIARDKPDEEPGPDEGTFWHRDNRFTESEHGCLLVLGNGVDVLSDWGYTEGDADGFNKAMEAFNAEDYA